MESGYASIAGLFVVGVVLAFPVAVAIGVALGRVLSGADWFTAHCPGFRQVRRWVRRREYRPGRVVTRFRAPDVRRDVEVVDASQIDAGVITARVRTWNLLYAARGLAPVPPFGEARAVEIRELW